MAFDFPWISVSYEEVKFEKRKYNCFQKVLGVNLRGGLWYVSDKST